MSKEWCIPSDVDASAVLKSDELVGCYGYKPVPQTKDYTCGAAAAAGVLRWFGINANEYQCAEAMKTNAVIGTRFDAMVKYLRRRGLKAMAWARFPTEELLRRSSKQLPTLVEWLDWGGHWVAHVGYEPTQRALVFADPARPRSNFCCHSVSAFEKNWRAPERGVMDIPAVAITIDRWGRGELKPDEHYGEYKSGGYSKQMDWSTCLIDWPTRKNWGKVRKLIQEPVHA